jgi:translocation and assembly module TamA
MRILLSFLLYLSCICATQAQNLPNYSLQIHFASPAEEKIIKKYAIETKFTDTVEAKKTLKILLEQLQYAGYLTASFDSVWVEKKQVHASLYLGKSYKFLQIDASKVPPAMLQAVNFRAANFQQKKLAYKEYLTLKNKLLNHAQNTGYPFASVFLDSISIENAEFSAKLQYEKGTYIVFDSLLVVGKNPLKMNKKFLSDYLKLYRKQAFSQKKVDDAEKLLRTLPYLKLLSKPEVTFERDRAFVLLNTEALKVNQFDGIVGLLPNAGNNNQLQFTGQINLKLYNLFQSGKNLQIAWQSPRTQSQMLNIAYEHPNLFKTRIDVAAKLHLNKRDTSFVNFSWHLQLSYWLGGGAKLLAFTEFLQTTTDSLQTNSIGNNFADTQLQRYGLGFEFQNTDDMQTPRKGWQLKLTASAGNKNIKPQWEVDNPIYKTLQLRSTQIQANLVLSRFLQTGKNTTLLLQTQAGVLLNNRLFINELFQLGGIKNIRGFNELAFYSPHYSIQTAEWRLYFEQNSSIFGFVDYGFMAVRLGTETTLDTPLGLGGGFSFATKAGIFSFVAAVGKSNTQNIGINQTKIHFGLTTRF